MFENIIPRAKLLVSPDFPREVLIETVIISFI